jgi:hypothetical protein
MLLRTALSVVLTALAGATNAQDGGPSVAKQSNAFEAAYREYVDLALPLASETPSQIEPDSQTASKLLAAVDKVLKITSAEVAALEGSVTAPMGRSGPGARPWIGIALEKDARGLRIAEVVGGAAKQAGLQRGDVVLTVDGKPAARVQDFTVQVLSHRVGDKARIRIVREEEEKDVVVQLEARPPDKRQLFWSWHNSDFAWKRLNLRIYLVMGRFARLRLMKSPGKVFVGGDGMEYPGVSFEVTCTTVAADYEADYKGACPLLSAPIPKARLVSAEQDGGAGYLEAVKKTIAELVEFLPDHKLPAELVVIEHEGQQEAGGEFEKRVQRMQIAARSYNPSASQDAPAPIIKIRTLFERAKRSKLRDQGEWRPGLYDENRAENSLESAGNCALILQRSTIDRFETNMQAMARDKVRAAEAERAQHLVQAVESQKADNQRLKTIKSKFGARIARCADLGIQAAGLRKKRRHSEAELVERTRKELYDSLNEDAEFLATQTQMSDIELARMKDNIGVRCFPSAQK